MDKLSRCSSSWKARSTAGRTSRCLHGLKLKDGRSGQHRVENAEVWVLRGGGNHRNLPIFHEFQQGLLLFFVKVLDFVQVEQHTVGGHQGVHIGDHLPDVPNGGSCRIEPVEGAPGGIGDDIGHGGLAGPRGAVEHQIGHLPALDDPAEDTVFAQNMPLPHHFVQSLGADFICKGTLVHSVSS